MRNLTHWLLLISFIALCSCNNHPNSAVSSTTTNKPQLQFDTFYAKFKARDLPLILRPCDTLGYPDSLQLKDEHDSVFGALLPEYAYGKIKTNSNYRAVILLAEADCLKPQLITYDNNGEQIDNKDIALGGCGSDIGYRCSEAIVFGADYSIYAVDTSYQQDLDSLDNVIPGGTTVVYRVLSEGETSTKWQNRIIVRDSRHFKKDHSN